MSVWDVVKDIALIITPIVIGVGFFFAHRQLVSNRNTRMAEIVLSITSRWDSTEMHESRCKLNQLGGKLGEAINKADSENTEDFYPLLRVADFFDALGLLVMEGFLSREMAFDLFGAAEEHYYNLYRPTISDHRFRSSFISFERLNETFKKEAAKRCSEEPRHTE